MPYKVVGSDLYHKKGGKWSVKSHHDNPQLAHIVMTKLQQIDEGRRKTWGERLKARKGK